MSIMISDNKKDLVITCKCGCNDSIYFTVNEDYDSDLYFIQTYMSGNWQRDQGDSILQCIGRKAKKIWSIIRNKDYYYSDIILSKDDFNKYKEYIKQF